MKQRVVEKEWKKLRKAEKAFLDKNREDYGMAEEGGTVCPTEIK